MNVSFTFKCFKDLHKSCLFFPHVSPLSLSKQKTVLLQMSLLCPVTSPDATGYLIPENETMRIRIHNYSQSINFGVF